MDRKAAGLIVVLFLGLALVGVACSKSKSSAGENPSFSFIGFADHPGPANNAPPGVIQAGGTLNSCNPANLYAFANFSNLQPPKVFTGTWTKDGAFLSKQDLNEKEMAAVTFWQVAATPTPLAPGAYHFEIKIDDRVMSGGDLKLTCS